jgi:hypothetical protein
MDHVERDQRGQDHHRHVAEQAELLGDASVARTGGDRDADPDRPGGEQRREDQLRDDVRRPEDGRSDGGLGEQDDGGDEDEERQVRDQDGRHQRRHRLAEQELLARNRRRQHRLEGALLTLARDRVGREHGRREDRDGQHVQQQVQLTELGGGFTRRAEDHHQWLDQEDQREDRRRRDDRPVTPVLAQLLPDDRPDASRAEAHRGAASGSSSISSR